MSDSIISFAAFILADAGLEISSDNLKTVSKAAGANIESVWTDVYAKALEGKDLKEILSGFHAAGPAAASSGSAAATSSASGEAAEEEVEEDKEESDDDMGFGLFD